MHLGITSLSMGSAAKDLLTQTGHAKVSDVDRVAAKKQVEEKGEGNLEEIAAVHAKARLAAKPMVLYEPDDMIAIASEEVSLNRLFPGQALDTTEPAPGTFATWSLST